MIHFLPAVALILLLGAIYPSSLAQQSSEAASQTSLPRVETPPTPASSVKPVSLSDLAWLQGQWAGAWGPRTAVQVWSAPLGGAIVGTLKIVEGSKTLVIEFVTITQTASGVKYQLLHFTPSLVPWEKSGPAVLSLMSTDTRKFVFDNATQGKPQQIVLVRTDPDTYIDRSEIVIDSADPKSNEITFHRQKPSAGSASRR